VRRWLVPLAALAAVAAILTGARALAGDKPSGETRAVGDQAGGSGPAYWCGSVDQRTDGGAAAAECDRIAVDTGRRSAVSTSQRQAAMSAAQSVMRVVSGIPFALDCDPQCTGRTATPLPRRGTNDPGAVQAALRRAGYRDAVARLARSDDPAPAGTTVYAVPVPGGCVVGYQRGIAGAGNLTITGRLPGGHCLTP
jgi:hypothetical protein